MHGPIAHLVTTVGYHACDEQMVAYFHRSIFRFHFGLPGLVVRFVLLYLEAFGAFGVLSLLSMLASGYCALSVVREQLIIHGTPTSHLSMQQLPQRPLQAGIKGGTGPDLWRNWQPRGDGVSPRKSE